MPQTIGSDSLHRQALTESCLQGVQGSVACVRTCTDPPLPASLAAAVQGNWNLGKITTAAIKNWLDTPEAVANGLAARRDAELAMIKNANVTFVVRWGSC